MKASVYNKEGKETGTLELPEAVFGAKWNADLVHQVVEGMRANARAGLARAHTKGRGEVRGGGKKPWRQKGTGRARHGSSRSPIWKGGGVTHGPKAEKDYSQTIPKKMRVRALYSALSQKLRDGEIVFVDALSFDAPKAKDAKGVIAALAGIKEFAGLSKKKTNAALVALPAQDQNAKKSFRNFGNIGVELATNLNVVDILTYKYLIITNPDESVKILESKIK